MIAALEICLVSRTDGVDVGCWPWWATPLPVVALLLLCYLLFIREERT